MNLGGNINVMDCGMSVNCLEYIGVAQAINIVFMQSPFFQSAHNCEWGNIIPADGTTVCDSVT